MSPYEKIEYVLKFGTLERIEKEDEDLKYARNKAFDGRPYLFTLKDKYAEDDYNFDFIALRGFGIKRIIEVLIPMLKESERKLKESEKRLTVKK